MTVFFNQYKALQESREKIHFLKFIDKHFSIKKFEYSQISDYDLQMFRPQAIYLGSI